MDGGTTNGGTANGGTTRRAALLGMAMAAGGALGARAQGAPMRDGALRDGAGGPGAEGAALAAPGPEAGSFDANGRAVRTEWFAPAGARARGPAVLVLHGADGLEGRNALAYRQAASRLAAGGVGALLVNYFDATGGRGDWFALRGQIPTWIGVAREGLSDLAARRGVDPARLGLVGFSLGAAISLGAAALDPRVRAVVDVFGPVPEGFEALALRVPPVLVLHGEEDRVVPVSNARRLQAFLEARGAPHEVRIYPGQGHGFTGEAQADAARRIGAFLKRHLG